ncbi:hypothetical protein [Xanthomonas maliensis]|uniref:hypothetical protein n=1 Tax=Xanthomonas maliensis TaxID=1321368 RepID=UPI0012655B8E|nr:hypothetical protein [Xanthomonas maliensis]
MTYWVELKSKKHAKDCLEILFPHIENKEEYADIAWFLTEKGRFESVLEDVSKELWRLFPEMRPGSNRLTRAIREMASRYGFSAYSDNQSFSARHVVYIDNIDGKTFVKNIQDKVLWKDSFGFGHGEFSHSYQWLSIGMNFGWASGTAELYAGTAARSASGEPIYVQEGADVIERRVTLWQWLLDCVNEKSENGPTGWTKAHTEKCQGCFSNSYRFANSVQSLISRNPDWLIGYYSKIRGEILNSHRDRAINDAYNVLHRFNPEIAKYVKRKKREIVENFLKDGVSNNYNDGIAQRSGLLDHYRDRSEKECALGHQSTLVKRGVVEASIILAETDYGLENVEATFHGEKRRYKKLRRIE